MSYYKYKERDEATRVNWNAITTDVVKTLKDQEAAREEKRQTIEDNYRNSLQQIADAPQGENKSINQWILNASSDMSNHLMMMNRNLKSGLIDPRDYTVARQNIDDGWSQFKQVSEMALEQSKITTERATNGEGMMAEAALFNDLNKFQQWDKSQLYINPNTSVMTIGLTDPDGKLMDGVGNFTTMEGFANRMRTRFDSYAYSDDIRAQVDKLGKDIRLDFSKNPAGYTSIEDFAQKFTTGEDFERYVTDTVTALANTDLKTLSVIEQGFDKMGFKNIEYDPSAEKTTIDADGNITVGFKTNNDGTTFPVLDDGGLMQKAAEGFLAEEFKAMLAYEEKFQYKPVKPSSPPSAAYAKFKADSAAAKVGATDKVNSIGQLWYGTENQKNEAGSFLAGLDPNIKGVEAIGDQYVQVTFKDGNIAQFPFKDSNNNIMPQDQFLRSVASTFGIDNFDDALKRSQYDPNQAFSSASGGFTLTEQESDLDAYNRIVADEFATFNNAFLIGNDPIKSQQKVQNWLSGVTGSGSYQVEAIGDGGIGSDFVIVRNPDGNEVARINVDATPSESDVEAFKSAIQNSLENNAVSNPKSLEALVKGKKQVAGSGQQDNQSMKGFNKGQKSN